MSRITNNISSIIAQRVLGVQTTRLNTSLQRLSTGLRINSGKDDPAGLIASEKMRSEKAAINAAQSNVSRASNVVAVSESGLSEIAGMLNDLESLVDLTSNEAGITEDERRANQLEIDSILDSIDRIANSTELQGRKLLNGSLGYVTSSVHVSQVAGLQINSARIPQGSHAPVNIRVTGIASMASISYISGTIAGSARTIEVAGNIGREIFTFGVGTTVANMVSAINQATKVTGVSATASGTGYVHFRSTGYGSSQFVRVQLLNGSSYGMSGNKYEDYGRDVTATVNGMTTIGDGFKIGLRTAALNLDMTLTKAMATQTTAAAVFQITGGGAKFAVSPRVDEGSITALGIPSLNTTKLGDRNTGLLYTLATGEKNALNQNNFSTAQAIIRLAADQVASLRGRLGAFQKDTLDPAASSLGVQYENVSAAESAIRDTDFAQETANLTRGQIMVQAATMVLKQANASPQSVLSLLQ
jgi:flagellin